MKRRLLLMSYLLTGCTSFPYGGLIQESERFVREAHPEAFKSFKSQDQEIRYVTLGNPLGPIVLFVHGSPGSWGAYANYFKNTELLERFQLVSFDRWGYGAHLPGEPKEKLSVQAELPLSILEHLNPESSRSVIVVGHSYGGPVAAYLAAHNPERIQGLVLLAASVDPKLEKMKWYQYVAETRAVRWLVPSDLDVCNREILGLKAELEVLKPRLGQITQPTSVLQGEIDVLVPMGNLDYLKENLTSTKARFQLLPKARHFLPWAFPSKVAESISWVGDEIQKKKESK